MRIRSWGFFFCFVFASCSSYKISKFDDYTETLIQKSEKAPSKNDVNDLRRDVVIAKFRSFDDKDVNKLATSAFSSLLDARLMQYKHINVLNRSTIKDQEVKDEVELLEAKGKMQYSGPLDAEYILTGSVDTLVVDSKLHSRGLLSTILKGLGVIGGIALGLFFGSNSLSDALIAGSLVSTPADAKYEYKANLSGFVRVLDAKTLEEIVKLPFAVETEDAEDASVGSIVPQLKNAKENSDLLVVNAIKKAVDLVEKNIVESLPMKGYVMQRRNRRDSDRTIFLVNFGSDLGLKQGMAVKIIHKEMVVNGLTNEEEEDSTEIHGFVSDKISPKSCWVLFENSKDVEKIRTGDLVLVEWDKK